MEQFWRCTTGGRSVLVENESVVESIPTETSTEAFTPDQVFRFSKDLTRLGQGVIGVGVADAVCLPIVTSDYFRMGRAPSYGVQTIDRSQTQPAPLTGPRRFFVFSVPGAVGFQFAVSMNQVLEVAHALPVAPLNFENSHFAGVAVWRGETIPVIDLALAAKLGTMRRDCDAGRLMVVRNAANRIMAIPSSGTVRQSSAGSQVYAPDSGSVRAMRGIRGVFRFEGSPLLVPDLDALVD